MNKYEVMYILNAEKDEQEIKALIERFNSVITSAGGTIDKTEEWGKRKLAYDIDYKSEGYYVLQYFSAKPELPSELERNFKINENVIRFMITRAH